MILYILMCNTLKSVIITKEILDNFFWQIPSFKSFRKLELATQIRVWHTWFFFLKTYSAVASYMAWNTAHTKQNNKKF